jgi:hypothetical protein
MARALSTRALNRAILARQLLLERTETSIVRAVEKMGGVQAQYAPSTYVGLWSRMHDLSRSAVTDALADGRLIQATLMRSTIHVVSARDFRAFAAATRGARREHWLRFQKKALEGIDIDAVAARVQHHLAGGPRRAPELQKLLAQDGVPRIAAVAVTSFLDIVRVPPCGTWEQRRADLYGLAPAADDPKDATEHLVARYLGAFGPAAFEDIVSWTGLRPDVLRPVIARMKIRRFTAEDNKELLDVARAPLPDPDTPAPVRFLPTWDASLLVHARRTQILPEKYRKLIFSTKTPHSVGTFLVDGAVAGTWRVEKDRVIPKSIEKLGRADQRAVDEEAARLTAFHA